MDEIEFSIGDRLVGRRHIPLVIVEIGINHGGDLEVAKNMVALAAQSGAEMVKHQTHFVEDEMTEEAKSIFPPNDSRSIWQVMEDCSLTADEERELQQYCHSLGLMYISTPFSRKAVQFLDSIDVPAFKIGSGEADNLPLIEEIASKGRPVILSTGMQSIETIAPAVQLLRDAGVPYALLECTNLYPSPPDIVSLSGIDELRDAFSDAVVGFSDHSIGPWMAIAALGRGASIIERHFTDSRYRVGPDISCAMDPAELRLMVDIANEVHIAINNPKQRSDAENSVYRFARSSVVADKNLPAGTILTKEDVWTRRPGNGNIPGYELKKVIGKTLAEDVGFNQQLSWNMFE